jgi:RimJ/RimL family protein N-acetyltransferase
VDVAPPKRPLSDGVVSLRPWREDDVAALVTAIDGDPEITAWLELIPQPYTETEAMTWVAATRAMWRDGSASPFAVTASGDVVGGVGVNWIDREQAVGDVGYWLRRAERGNGYTTRAVRVVSRWAFECGCERLQLRADADNTASRRVAERVGFRHEGVQRSARYNPRLGRRMNFVVYSLLPTDPLDLPDAAT